MRNKIVITIFVFLLILSLCVFCDVNFPKVNQIEVKTDKISMEEDIKIVQITDLHNKKFLNNQSQIYNKIEKINPDIIVLTGDIIDEKTKDYSYIYSFIDSLLKINSRIYYVFGNHELSHGNIDESDAELKKRGVIMINQDFQEREGIDIYGAKYYNVVPSINNSSKFSLLLIHDPSHIINNPNNFDLILSGHTHGGQVRFPLVGALYVPGQGFFPQYSKGLFKIEDSWLYIDSGLGSTAFPVRFLNQSQFSVINIIAE